MRMERDVESVDEQAVTANMLDLYQTIELVPGVGTLSGTAAFAHSEQISYVTFPPLVATDWIVNARVRAHLMGKGAQLAGAILYSTSSTSTNAVSLDVQVRPVKSGGTGTPASWASTTLSITPPGVAAQRALATFSFLSSTPDLTAQAWAWRLRRNVDTNPDVFRVALVTITFVEVP